MSLLGGREGGYILSYLSMQIGLNRAKAKSNVSLSHNSSAVRSKQQTQAGVCSQEKTWPQHH